MEQVLIEPGTDGLGAMVGELVKANLAAHPARAALLSGPAGSVVIDATDAGAKVGLIFTGKGLRVGAPLPRPDLAIACDAATLMELTAVPLRFGLPDPLDPKGRTIVGKLARRQLKVRGMVPHLALMIRLQKLLSVA
jgi:hypothetical protein